MAHFRHLLLHVNAFFIFSPRSLRRETFRVSVMIILTITPQKYKKSKQSNINKFLRYANEKFIRVWWLFAESERPLSTYRKHIFAAEKRDHIYQGENYLFSSNYQINIINITAPKFVTIFSPYLPIDLSRPNHLLPRRNLFKIIMILNLPVIYGVGDFD